MKKGRSYKSLFLSFLLLFPFFCNFDLRNGSRFALTLKIRSKLKIDFSPLTTFQLNLLPTKVLLLWYFFFVDDDECKTWMKRFVLTKIFFPRCFSLISFVLYFNHTTKTFQTYLQQKHVNAIICERYFFLEWLTFYAFTL
jgi:hypothetical protein